MDTSTEDVLALPEPASVQEQFSKRAIFVVCSEVHLAKQSSAYWLTNLMADDSNIDDTPEDKYVNPSPLDVGCSSYNILVGRNKLEL